MKKYQSHLLHSSAIISLILLFCYIFQQKSKDNSTIIQRQVEQFSRLASKSLTINEIDQMEYFEKQFQRRPEYKRIGDFIEIQSEKRAELIQKLEEHEQSFEALYSAYWKNCPDDFMVNGADLGLKKDIEKLGWSKLSSHKTYNKRSVFTKKWQLFLTNAKTLEFHMAHVRYIDMAKNKTTAIVMHDNCYFDVTMQYKNWQVKTGEAFSGNIILSCRFWHPQD